MLVSYVRSAADLDQIDFRQVKKCIDTISFVVNHMSTELSNLNYFNPGKLILLYKDRTPSGRRRRRQRNRPPQNQKKQTIKYE